MDDFIQNILDQFTAVREQVDRAAAAIISTGPDNVDTWILHLLQVLDDYAGHDFDNTLASVQAAIKIRVETGQW